MTAGTDSAIDGDTGDPTVTPTRNNEIGMAQALRNPVSVGGYANKASDEFDIYRVDLAGGQLLNLFVSEDGIANDLDMLLGDASGNVLAGSFSTGNLESIEVPGTGTATYLVQINAFSGASNYVLSIAQQGQTTAARATHGMRTQAEFVPDQAIVTYRPDAGTVSAKSLGVEKLASIPGSVDLVSLAPMTAASKPSATPAGLRYSDSALAAKANTLLAIKTLQQQPAVKLAEPNLIRRHFALPNDEFLSQQWHYNLINLPQAWDITRGSGSVLVAVVDTGVRLAHPDLIGKFDPADPNGFDFISNIATARDGDGRDGNADDPGDGDIAGGSSFHGTHVAGTIAATTDNSIGVAGAGWDTRIMPLRVLGQGGGSSFDIQDAIRYAARLPNSTGLLPPVRASIINLSLGSDSGSSSDAQAYADVVASGVIVIAAAGNEGDSRMGFPASYPGVVSVASVGRQKQRAPYSQFNSAVDVAAPGGDLSRGSADGVFSAHASDSSGAIVNTVKFLQGTSMAAPHMAGVVALMKAVNPSLTPAQLDALLAGGTITEDLGTAGRDNAFGHGLIDANKAVREAIRLASGGAPANNPRLTVQPESLDFGSALSSTSFDARNAGTGSLAITAVSDDAPWLSVSAQTVDANGLGRYVATVDRSGLAEGNYSAAITIASGVNTVRVPVLMRVGVTVGGVNAGKQYVLLVNPETFATVVQADLLISAAGTYGYSFNVPNGSYVVIAGTDSDNDGEICDDGESCGGFPLLDSLRPVTVNGAALPDVNFLVSFDLSVPTAQGTTTAPRRSYRRLR